VSLCLHFNTDTIQGLWQTKLDEIAVNGKNILLSVANKSVIIDSGFYQVLGPHEAIVEFYENIPGSARIVSSDGPLNGQYACTPVNRVDCQSS
jgi:hypothetical protein